MPTTTVPTITLATSVAKDPGVLVVGLAEASEGPVLVGIPDDLARSFGKSLGAELVDLAQQLGGSAKPGRTVLMAGPGGLRVVVVGLGPIDVTPEEVRRATGAAVRLVAGLSAPAPQTVTISLEVTEPQVITGAAEGALLGSYSYRPASPDAAGVGQIVLVSPNKRADARQAWTRPPSPRAVITRAEW